MMKKQLTHGALFNGIAGFPLAAAWAGIPTEWTVEIDPFCNLVSKKHFPDAIQYTDIHHATNLPYVDIISGGFPCQPYSVAGKQLGNEDDRALWPQMLRIIREVKPAYVIGENVAGLINLALDDVLASLEAEGYTTETFVVPACAVNAPHRRDRLWIIAYTESNGSYRASGKGCSPVKGPNQQLPEQPEQRSEIRAIAYANSIGGQVSPPGEQPAKPLSFSNGTEGGVATNANQLNGNFSGLSAGEISQQQKAGILDVATNTTRELPHRPGGTRHRRPESADGSWRLTEPPVCGSDDGLPSGLVRNRSKQLKAYGNAIVPQVAYQIFQAIKAIAAA